MTRVLVMLTFLLTITAGPLGAQPRQVESDAWRTLAASLPAGAPVALRLKDGRRFTGTIVEVREEGLLFKPKTRVPVPAGDVAFAEIDSLELPKPGMSPGTKVLVGVGIGVGTFLLVVLALVASLE
jgi:hypothetical protein